MEDSWPTWLKVMENGAIGEARTRSFLIDRFWVLVRSVDTDGADFLIQRRSTTQRFTDKVPPRVGVIQAKYFQDRRTTHHIPQSYVVDAGGAPLEGFFALLHVGKEDEGEMYLLSARQIADTLSISSSHSPESYIAGTAALQEAFRVKARKLALDQIEHSLKSQTYYQSAAFLDQLNIPYRRFSEDDIEFPWTLPLPNPVGEIPKMMIRTPLHQRGRPSLSAPGLGRPWPFTWAPDAECRLDAHGNGDMRRDLALAQVLDELAHVIGLVGPERDAPPRLAALQHGERGLALGCARGLGDAAIHGQAVTVLHQRMAHVAQLRRLTVALLVEPRLRVARALVRVVGALLLVKAALGVATGSIRIVVAAILAAEALDRGQGLDQRPVHREVIRRQQPIPVLCEARMVPGRLVNAEPHEPAEQKVELHPLHQLTLRANAVEGLQQHRTQQQLRRDRRSAEPGRIKHRKIAVHPHKSRVHDLPYHPQRMVTANASLKVDIRKQRTCPFI